MHLIVGLGNPGREYVDTPHNLGFAVVEQLAGELGGRPTPQRRGEAVLWRGRLEREQVLLAQPQTYMNRSGVAVAALLRSQAMAPRELIVVSDDGALPWGMIRVRERGSAGGHQGLASIIAALGTEEFVRVRLGIQPATPVADLADYVLEPMGRAEAEISRAMVRETADAVRMILREGVKRAMNRFNRRASVDHPPDGEDRRK